MNFEFAEKINPYLEQLNFARALDIAETELRKIPPTDFHYVLDKTLIDHADLLATWVGGFYNLSVQKNEVETLYFEINEFDINTEHWYIDCFAYSTDGGLDPEYMEWLCDYDTDSQTETGFLFKIEGYEPLQDAFENIALETDDLQNARDWCEQIIIARFIELMATTHRKAKDLNLNWGKIPVYFTEHSYDFVVRSTN